jgi:hypothetical protein
MNPHSIHRSPVQMGGERKNSVGLGRSLLQCNKTKRRASENQRAARRYSRRLHRVDASGLLKWPPRTATKKKLQLSTQIDSNGVSTWFSRKEQKRVCVLVVVASGGTCSSSDRFLHSPLGPAACGRRRRVVAKIYAERQRSTSNQRRESNGKWSAGINERNGDLD